MLRIVLTVSFFITSLIMVGCSSFVSVEQKFTDGSPYKYSAKKKSKFHTVRKGETLYSIAWTYGWDFRSLARANKIKSPYTIFKGQKIDVSNPRMIASARQNNRVSNSSKKSSHNKKSSKRTSSRRQSTPKVTTPDSAVTWKWPTQGKVVGRFSNQEPVNKGIDIQGQLGDSVKAAAAGTVVYAGKGLRGYGNLVIIKHSHSFLSAYAHTSKILVQEKDKVKENQKIAEIGSTGTNKVKLHFEIRSNGKPVDPLKYLPVQSGRN